MGQSNTLEIIISDHSEYCNTVYLHREFRYSDDIAFAVQKGSKLGEKISASLLRLTVSGALQQVIDKWKGDQSCEDNKKKHHQFPWQYGGGLSVVLGIAAGVCIIILFAENIYTYMQSKRSEVYSVSERHYSL